MRVINSWISQLVPSSVRFSLPASIESTNFTAEKWMVQKQKMDNIIHFIVCMSSYHQTILNVASIQAWSIHSVRRKSYLLMYCFSSFVFRPINYHLRYQQQYTHSNGQPKIHFLSKAALRIFPPLESPLKTLFRQKSLTISV